jgi:hypothetical protein
MKRAEAQLKSNLKGLFFVHFKEFDRSLSSFNNFFCGDTIDFENSHILSCARNKCFKVNIKLCIGDRSPNPSHSTYSSLMDKISNH